MFWSLNYIFVVWQRCCKSNNNVEIYVLAYFKPYLICTFVFIFSHSRSLSPSLYIYRSKALFYSPLFYCIYNEVLFSLRLAIVCQCDYGKTPQPKKKNETQPTRIALMMTMKVGFYTRVAGLVGFFIHVWCSIAHCSCILFFVVVCCINLTYMDGSVFWRWFYGLLY